MADWRKVMFCDDSTSRLVKESISWSVGLQESLDIKWEDIIKSITQVYLQQIRIKKYK